MGSATAAAVVSELKSTILVGIKKLRGASVLAVGLRAISITAKALLVHPLLCTTAQALHPYLFAAPKCCLYCHDQAVCVSYVAAVSLRLVRVCSWSSRWGVLRPLQ